MKLSKILLHILQMFTSYFVFEFFYFLSNFGHFWTLSNNCWNWWESAHHPQLLLNGWIDFNETFQNSFTPIADVHLLFCFWIISIFLSNCGLFWTLSNKCEMVGKCRHYPQLLLNGWIDFSETFSKILSHILQKCTSYFVSPA